MNYVIKKTCVCKGTGKMADVITGSLKKCLHCNGKGIQIIYTTKKCKYCAEPIESGYFCDACGRAFREDMEDIL